MTTQFTYKCLPPVGLVCEVELNGVYTECEILAHYDPCRDGDLVAVFAYATRGGRSTDQRVGPCFRKSEEHIALEKMEKAVAEMLELDPYLPNTALGMMSRSDFCRALYRAGYRKFEIVEEDV